jgi:hypothetical protein
MVFIDLSFLELLIITVPKATNVDTIEKKATRVVFFSFAHTESRKRAPGINPKPFVMPIR